MQRVPLSPHSRGLPPESFRSPTPGPKFYDQFDSPLSTKRERLLTPHTRANLSVPRHARTAPPVSRIFYAKRFINEQPRQVTCREREDSILQDNMKKLSTVYDPNKRATFFEQCFKHIEKIGEGSFGEVMRATSIDEGRAYAIKRSIEPFRNKSDRDLKLREVFKHEMLPRHHNLVEFVKAWEERGRLYIQTELCQQSLSEYCEMNHNIPECLIWDFFIDLISAVNLLHEHDLLHLDIKPENIFLTKDLVCKLGDFGLIFDINNDEGYTAEEGDSKYLAPEVLNVRPGKPADIFSLGITLLEVASDLDLPSRGNSWHDIRTGNIPERFVAHLSTELRSLIFAMIDPDPSRRPTAAQLVKHIGVRKQRRQMSIYLKGTTSFIVGHVCAFLLLLVSFVHTCFVVPFSRVKAAVLCRKAEISNSCASPFSGRYRPAVFGEQGTPEVASHGVIPRHLEFETSYSDDEGMFQDGFRVPAHRSNVNKTSQQLFGMDTNMGEDTDTPTSSSTSASTMDEDLVPVEDRLPCPPSPSPVISRLRSGTEVRPRRPLFKKVDMDASGDWGQPASKAPRIAQPNFDDDDEDMDAHDDMFLMVRSCPARPLMRAALREQNGARPVPKLDFSKLEPLDESKLSSLNSTRSERRRTPIPTPTSTRRQQHNPTMERGVADRGSSADEL